MAEGDLKEKLGKIVKAYGMNPKNVTTQVNEIASKIKGDKEEVILRLAEMAGKENIEVATAFLLEDINSKSDWDMDKILIEYKKFVEMPKYKEIGDKVGREKLASKAVMAQIAFEKRVQSKMFEILVLGKSSPRVIKTTQGEREIASIAAYCKSLEDGNIDPFYRSLSFWGEISKKVRPLIIGHKYHGNLVRNRSVDSLSAWDPHEKSEFIEKGKFDGDVMDIIDSLNIQKIQIAEADIFISKTFTEYRRIDCDIVGRQIMTRGNSEMGMMFVVDESSEDLVYGNEDGEATGGFTVFSDPQNLQYGEGSGVILIGRISKNKDNGRIAMNADAVIPTLAVPVDMMPVDEEEDIDMKTGGEPVINPDDLEGIGDEEEDILMDDEQDDMFTDEE